jgi:hypothetical protein
MRVRTGRFEKLRSAEPRYPQLVRPSQVQYSVQKHSAVAPPARGDAHRQLCSFARRFSRDQFPVGGPLLTTSTSADSSHRLDTVAPSGIKRGLPREEPIPSLHHRGIYVASLGSRELRSFVPARPGPQRLLSGSCSSARSFDPRFLPTLRRPHAVALLFARCDLLATRLHR